jgi:hypothetical protein
VNSNPRTIVWIASYPKSGNTWLRFLACNLIFGPQDSAAALNELAPDLHELRVIPEPPRQRLLMKTHFPYSVRLPLVDSTAAALQVVRHPADVMLSNFHYSRRSGAHANAQQAELDAYVERFIAEGGDPRWTKLGMGTWEENVRSWSSGPPPFPVLRLRYEDLLADTLGAAQTLCNFLGLERSAAQVSAAVDGASFANMRRIEEADVRAQRVGIFYKPYLRDSIDSGLRFMRSGKSGEAARTLSPDQRLRMERVLGAQMRELGYPTTP